MPCYLSVQDTQLRIIETNDMFARDFGDAIGEYCYQAYKQRTTPCTECPVLKTLESGESHSSEETVVTRRGDLAQVVVTSTPVLDPRGKIVAAVEMSTNITEVQTLRKELDRTSDRLNRLFDIVPCYISIQDRDLRIIDSNHLFKRDFGDFLDQHCYRAYKGRDSTCPGCSVIKCFDDGAVHSSEERVITRDGQIADVVVYSTPIIGDDGKVNAVMEVSTNITEVKQQHKLAMMGLAVAGMAHRIKNILMGLEGGVLIINDGFDTGEDESVSQGWKMVVRNVEKISKMVRDLLYCSKERRPDLREEVSPAEIVREVCELYRPRTAEDGIDLRLEMEGPAHRGTYDPEGLHNLVVNLVTNAVDACRFDPASSEKKHLIIVRCQRDGVGATVIEIADNGAGIPEDARPKVFQGFFSTKGTEGTGLGLLVVQRVVEEHGGTISLCSSEGEGTTFSVTLPDERRGPKEPAVEDGGS
jgi:signal transduction histidine kinase